MGKTKKLLLGFLVLAILGGQAAAAIFGFFPGLPKLIKRTEFIVVAQIVRQASAESFDLGGGAVQGFRILAVLKGKIKKGIETEAYLRQLPFTDGSDRKYSLIPNGFRVGQRYVLFLVKNSDPKIGVPYRNTNSSGDAFWVAPSTDLSKLKQSEVRGNIAVLMNDVIAYKKAKLREFEGTVKAYLGETNNR